MRALFPLTLNHRIRGLNMAHPIPSSTRQVELTTFKNSANDDSHSNVRSTEPTLGNACRNRNLLERQQAVNSTSAVSASHGVSHDSSPQIMENPRNAGQPRYKPSMNQRYPSENAGPYSPYVTPQALNAGNNWTLSASSVTRRI